MIVVDTNLLVYLLLPTTRALQADAVLSLRQQPIVARSSNRRIRKTVRPVVWEG